MSDISIVAEGADVHVETDAHVRELMRGIQRKANYCVGVGVADGILLRRVLESQTRTIQHILEAPEGGVEAVQDHVVALFCAMYKTPPTYPV